MTDLSTTERTALRNLLQGVQGVVDVPMAFDRDDPDKQRIREIQALVAFVLRSELPAGSAERLQPLVGQLKLLLDEIAGVGARVTMKPAARLVERAATLLGGRES